MADKSVKKVENKKLFEVEVDGVKRKLAVKKPDQEQQDKASFAYNLAFRNAVQPEGGGKGVLVRNALENVLRDQGFWDEAKKAKYKELNKKLEDAEKKLLKGRIKLSEGREIAIQMRRDRYELQMLTADKNALDLNTAEAMAENAKFNYLVSVCTFDPETGKPYFKDAADYNKRSGDVDALAAASAFAQLQYGIADDAAGRLFENKWLRAYGFSDEKHNLIRKDGRRVDAQNRLINEEGFLVDELNRPISEDGELLNPDGSFQVEAAPFLDDEGNPVAVPEALKSAPKEDEAKDPVEAPEKSPFTVAVDPASGPDKTVETTLEVSAPV